MNLKEIAEIMDVPIGLLKATYEVESSRRNLNIYQENEMLKEVLKIISVHLK